LKFGKNILIPFNEARDKFLTGSAVFIDARTPEHYQEGHIRGALNVPLADFDQMMERVLTELPEEALIVTYCDGEDCDLSAQLALKLRKLVTRMSAYSTTGGVCGKAVSFPSSAAKDKKVEHVFSP